PSALVTVVKDLAHGKPAHAAFEAVLAAVGIRAAGKAGRRIGRFLRGRPQTMIPIADKLAGWLGENSKVLRAVLKYRIPGYGKLRDGDLSHTGVMQLMRSGNDIKKLAAAASLFKRTLTAEERTSINKSILGQWGNPRAVRRRSQAYGHEASIRMIERNDD